VKRAPLPVARAPRESKRIPLPAPHRTRYVLALGANMELVVSCSGGLELCVTRAGTKEVRVWTRAKKRRA
jgi:hypothetical protein